MDEAGCIGFEGCIPWHLSRDLARFKRLTMGHHLIVGRRTWESIGRALPGRTMIVVSRNPDYPAQGAVVATSLDAALQAAEAAGESEAFIGGGTLLFAEALPVAGRIYLTQVHTRTTCDTYFPPFDWQAWKEIEREQYPAGEKDQFQSTYLVLERAWEAAG